MRQAVASVVVRAGAGGSSVHRARPSGPLRLLCPQRPGHAAWVVTGNLGGGLVDGDDLALEVTVDRGATKRKALSRAETRLRRSAAV